MADVMPETIESRLKVKLLNDQLRDAVEAVDGSYGMKAALAGRDLTTAAGRLIGEMANLISLLTRERDEAVRLLSIEICQSDDYA